MYWFEKIINKKKRFVIGLMSGTSVDGVDAALVEIEGNGPGSRIRLADFICVPYEKNIRNTLMDLHETFTVGLLSDMNFRLGEIFAESVLSLLSRSATSPEQIDIIGSHGHTIYHNPPSSSGEGCSTLQIGEIDIIAERTGITTIGDFRPRDMASGGEGAPLMPYADYLLFSGSGGCKLAQNIGGIANLTLVTENIEDVVAFDTGPGNCLIDLAVGLSTGWQMNYDHNGGIAASGRVEDSLLGEMLRISYFSMPPPKSTGRELFGIPLARKLYSEVESKRISLPDLISTLTQLTVDSIYSAYERFILPYHDVSEVILSGGGARNTEMVTRLGKKLDGIRLVLSDEYGIPAEAKEAVGFAVLANDVLAGINTNIKNVTGASKSSPLGKIAIGNISK